jgi:hypothetical protein
MKKARTFFVKTPIAIQRAAAWERTADFFGHRNP